MARLQLIAAVLLLLFGCANPEDGPRPIEGSTYRIGTPTKPGKEDELQLKMFTSREECRAAIGGESADDCVPQIDRSTGQVRLAFQLVNRENGLPYLLPLQQDHVQVSHNKRPIQEGAKSGYELVQHNPKRASQLFIVLIDGSGSMYENDNEQINKLYKALMRKSVIDAFFPKEKVTTGVVLLRFTSTVRGLDGGPPRVIEHPRQYEEMVRTYMYSRDRGFTHLYDSIEEVIGPMLIDDGGAVYEWLQVNSAEPTVIALTDGFNNEKGSDLCRTNTDRLTDTLEQIEMARNRPMRIRPSIYTVGIGKPIRPGFVEVPNGRPTDRLLCGKYANEMINGRLERQGIDNVSLSWIAERGGGTSFVENNSVGLAKVFQEAASMRYEWYSAFYKVDKFHHRQKFETRIRLISFATAESSVEVFPSAWVDGPTATRGDGRWSEPTPLKSTFALIMPLLGGMVLLTFFGPASFNARRAVFRRARGGGRKAAGQPQQPPPDGQPPAQA